MALASKKLGWMESILAGGILLVGFAACSLHSWGLAAKTTQQITQATTPQKPVSPLVGQLRPLAQAAGQAAGPIGETTLSLIAGAAGIVLAGISQYRRMRDAGSHKQALSELALSVPAEKLLALSPATKSLLLKAQSPG